MAVKRLIDGNALLKKIAHHTVHDSLKHITFETANTYEQVKGDMFSLVQKAPTIDAVEVVRCRECKKRGHDWECPLCWMEWFENEHIEGHFEKHDETEDDGFCHKGAKMDAKEVEADE